MPPHLPPPALLRALQCLLLTLGLTACSSMTTTQCRQADWRVLGWLDGQNGELPSNLLTYQQQCAGHGVNPDRYAYIEGWHAGSRWEPRQPTDVAVVSRNIE